MGAEVSEPLEQILLTDLEQQQLIAMGYRRMRMLEDGQIQVAWGKRDVTIPKGTEVVWLSWPFDLTAIQS